MTLHKPWLSGLVGLIVCFGASAEPLTLAQWRAQRTANLTSETGWLTLVGLLWLKEGGNSFGRAKSNRIALDRPALTPASGGRSGAPALAALGLLSGVFTESKGNVTLDGRPDGQDARMVRSHGREGAPVTTPAMAPDSTEKPTTLASGSLRFYVIERAGRLGVRVRDIEHPARKYFRGLDYFPEDPSWIVTARFEPIPATSAFRSSTSWA